MTLITTPIVTLTEANEYFSARLYTTAWDNATDVEKGKALSMATQALNGLNWAGSKADPAQSNAFPRTSIGTPTPIKQACCELAYDLLDGKNIDMELETLNLTAHSASTMKSTYDRSFAQEHITAGIVSATAWRLLAPYLTEVKRIKIVRVS